MVRGRVRRVLLLTAAASWLVSTVISTARLSSKSYSFLWNTPEVVVVVGSLPHASINAIITNVLSC